WALRMRSPERGIVDCWVTAFDRETPADFVIANHYTATHPQSAFVNRLMLRALLPDGRVSVHNRDVTIVRNGAAETSELADRAALRALLATHFGLDFAGIETLRVPTIPEWR